MEGWNNFLLNIIVKLFQSSVCYTIVWNISCETWLEFIQSYRTSWESKAFWMENSAKFTTCVFCITIKFWSKTEILLHQPKQNKKKVHNQRNDVHRYNILIVLPHLSYIHAHIFLDFLSFIDNKIYPSSYCLHVVLKTEFEHNVHHKNFYEFSDYDLIL